MIALFARVAILLALCAVVGFLLGRLIRGRKPAVERTRPRVAISGSYLRDAHDKSLSPHTRTRCAFEAIYFCVCEVAETHGLEIDGRVNPNDELLCAGLDALAVSDEDRKEVALLAKWAAQANPTLPEISINEACRLAVRVYRRSVILLSSSATQ